MILRFHHNKRQFQLYWGMCVKGDIKNVASLRHGTAEAIELVVHGDSTTSNVVGRQIGDIKLPVGAMIAAIYVKMRLSLHVVR